MLFGLKKAFVFLLMIGPILAGAQAVEHKNNGRTKPVLYEKLYLETALGIGASKLHTRPYYPVNYLLSPYAELALSIPLAPDWRLRTGINYQVIGSSLNYGAPQGGTAIANRKLTYLSAQVQAGYLLSKLANRIQIELLGGFFAAKQLNDLTVNRIPGQGVNRKKSIDSSIGYNYGTVLGLDASTLIHRHRHAGFRFVYHQGLPDIRTTTAKQSTGELPTITQAFTFCTFFSI